MEISIPGDCSAMVIILYNTCYEYLFKGTKNAVLALPFQRFRGFFKVNIYMSIRKLCPNCGLRPVAVNYRSGDITHYRRLCDGCGRKKKKLNPKTPAWALSGYKKKTHCERCGFKAKIPEQMNVFYIDGNLKNNNVLNLKTVCLNCQQEVYKSQLPWKAAPLIPDF